jgi:hypothetical protein
MQMMMKKNHCFSTIQLGYLILFFNNIFKIHNINIHTIIMITL